MKRISQPPADATSAPGGDQLSRRPKLRPASLTHVRPPQPPVNCFRSFRLVRSEAGASCSIGDLS
jgi:hypothetical protein